MVASRENFPLLDELLADQQRLQTPVAQFAGSHPPASGFGARHSALIPLTAPGPGEHYAFEVELDACTGCKSCVAACHSLNGLDEAETWRDVGLLVGTSRAHPFSQTVTTACHHCADPACLNGCPVLAYEKDPVTGIVRHLDDQCIGCSYCILKCPYDAPKFSERLGIVRKCDMCHGRLAHGEAPACVQACPTHAIRIVTVTTPSVPGGSEVSVLNSPPPAFLPSAPDPTYTQPTTRYVSRRKMPADVVAADAAVLQPQPPHWPLIALLVLMPFAIGCGLADKLVSTASPALAVTCWIAGAAGLALSILHLGQPTRAWRIFLGLRRSWLSREAVVFGLWFPCASAHLLVRLGWLDPGPRAHATLAVTTALLGSAGLLCSVMIYVDTRRHFWRLASTGPRFLGTAAVLGLATVLCLPDAPHSLALGLAGVTIFKLLLEGRALDPLNGDRDALTPPRKTALLLAGPLRTANEIRITLGLLGGILFPLLVALDLATATLAWAALPLCFAGEIAERYLFFRAVDAPKMPGLPSIASARAGRPSQAHAQAGRAG